MKTLNSYEGFDAYASKLIKHKARQLVGTAGLTQDDLPDIEQDMAIDLIQRLPHFNPAIAKKSTFMSRIVEHKIATIYESRKAACRDWRVCRDSLNQLVKHDDSEPFSEYIDLITDPQNELRNDPGPEDAYCFDIDLKRVFYSLPDDLLDFARRLRVKNLSEIALDLGVPRTTLYTKLKHLRSHFSAFHMEDYLNSRQSVGVSGKNGQNHPRTKVGVSPRA